MNFLRIVLALTAFVVALPAHRLWSVESPAAGARTTGATAHPAPPDAAMHVDMELLLWRDVPSARRQPVQKPRCRPRLPPMRRFGSRSGKRNLA